MRKIFEKCAAVQDDEAHAAEHALVHVFDDRVVDFLVGHVAPPDHDVGGVEDVIGEAVLRLVERGGADLEIARALAQVRGDRLVHALRVDLGDDRVVLLVPEFVPDGDADGHRWGR